MEITRIIISKIRSFSNFITGYPVTEESTGTNQGLNIKYSPINMVTITRDAYRTISTSLNVKLFAS
jgi:hypothetical protein